MISFSEADKVHVPRASEKKKKKRRSLRQAMLDLIDLMTVVVFNKINNK